MVKVTKFTVSQKKFGPDGYSIVENVTKMTDFDGEITSSNSYVRYSIMNPVDDRKFPTKETVDRIIFLTEQLVKFWTNPQGWAPVEAAELLSRSRLDRHASITRQLRLFTDSGNMESGYLILGWAALGSLTEGLLKLFLAVYYKTYQVHILIDEIARIVKDRKGNSDPDGLMFEVLRQFFEKKVFPENAKEHWEIAGELNWLEWLKKIQSRRNVIHAFKDREIGTVLEFHAELQNYLIFLRKIAFSLPYPDEVYEPSESIADASYSEVGITVGDRKVRAKLQWGKIKVLTKEDGDYLKDKLGLKGEVQIINPASVPDWD